MGEGREVTGIASEFFMLSGASGPTHLEAQVLDFQLGIPLK